MIRPEDVLLIVFEGKGCNSQLLRWMKRFPHRMRARPKSGLRDYICLWRNQLIREFLQNTNLPYVWLMDDDMVPVEDTMDLLSATGHVAACRCYGRTGREVHTAEGEVSAACLLASRHALQTVPPPWFAMVPDATGTAIKQCGCSFFSQRMREQGFAPVKLGRIGHLVPVIVLPGRQGDPFEIAWPVDPKGTASDVDAH